MLNLGVRKNDGRVHIMWTGDPPEVVPDWLSVVPIDHPEEVQEVFDGIRNGKGYWWDGAMLNECQDLKVSHTVEGLTVKFRWSSPTPVLYTVNEVHNSASTGGVDIQLDEPGLVTLHILDGKYNDQIVEVTV
jgi:hypothetical protein